MKSGIALIFLVSAVFLPVCARSEGDAAKNVQVTVTFVEKREVAELKGKVAITGSVNSPQAVEFKPGMSILDAVKAAGGFNRLALRNEYIITNSTSGVRISFRGPSRDNEAWREYYSRVMLQEGDVLFVWDIYF